MTIASEISRVDLVGDGVNDTFTFTFEIYVKTDIAVYVGGVLKTVDIHYTVPIAGIGNPDGGTIVFGAEHIPALAAIVSIILNLPYTQLIDYVEADKFPAETHERGLDRLVKIAQQLKERIARSMVLLESSQYSDLTLPDPVAEKYLAWKADLSGLKNISLLEVSGELEVSEFIEDLLDDEDAAAALATLLLTATAEEINTACDGITATATEINTVCDADNKFHSPLSIPASAFVPHLNTQDWNLVGYYLNNNAVLTSQSWHAPLNFPQGVTITRFTLFGYRNDAAAVLEIKLRRSDRENSVDTMATITADWTTGWSNKATETIDDPVVDNENYMYYLSLELDPNDSTEDVRFTAAKTEFTY